MFRIVILWAVITGFFSTFLQAKDKTPCRCGILWSDPAYATAVLLFGRALNKSFFFIPCNFPKDAELYYGPPDDLPYHFEGKFEWQKLRYSAFEKVRLLEPFATEQRKRGWYEFSSCPYIVKRIKSWEVQDPKTGAFIEEEKTIFDFQESSTELFNAFHALKADLLAYYQSSERFYKACIQDIQEYGRFSIFRGPYCYYDFTNEMSPKKFQEEIDEQKKIYSEKLQFIEIQESMAYAFCVQSLDQCINLHGRPMAYVRRGLFDYVEGRSIDALSRVKKALDEGNPEEIKAIQKEALILKGQSELEVGLYSDAITSLTILIDQNPQQKEMYLDRAFAYFELGRFDLSLKDYLSSGTRPQSGLDNSEGFFPFSAGLVQGILKGSTEATLDFIPSLLSSAQGIAHGLWAFALDPIQVSTDFVKATKICIEFVRTHTSQQIISQLVPELQTLIQDWDLLQESDRGGLCGQIIGKYGVDILAASGIVKGMQVYRDLRKANNLLTLEALTSSKGSAAIQAEACKFLTRREEVLKNANLKLHPGRQGKHIEGHFHYEELVKDRKHPSIFQHPDPEGLV